MKSGDQWCVPLCHGHHMELHDMGDEPLWFAVNGVEDPIAWARQTYAEWETDNG
jgi:hypothetical protein